MLSVAYLHNNLPCSNHNLDDLALIIYLSISQFDPAPILAAGYSCLAVVTHLPLLAVEVSGVVVLHLLVLSTNYLQQLNWIKLELFALVIELAPRATSLTLF